MSDRILAWKGPPRERFVYDHNLRCGLIVTQLEIAAQQQRRSQGCEVSRPHCVPGNLDSFAVCQLAPVNLADHVDEIRLIVHRAHRRNTRRTHTSDGLKSPK